MSWKTVLTGHWVTLENQQWWRNAIVFHVDHFVLFCILAVSGYYIICRNNENVIFVCNIWPGMESLLKTAYVD